MGANENPAEINGANKKNDKTENYSSSIIQKKSSGHHNIIHFPQPTQYPLSYYWITLLVNHITLYAIKEIRSLKLLLNLAYKITF